MQLGQSRDVFWRVWIHLLDHPSQQVYWKVRQQVYWQAEDSLKEQLCS